MKGVDCWTKCGQSGGECNECSVDGSPAYCCHNNLAPNELSKNGNCPLNAVSSMAGDNGYKSTHHTCVRKLYPGFLIFERTFYP